MTDLTLQSPSSFSWSAGAAAVQGSRGLWARMARLVVATPVTILLMVPDSEVHAKLFKAGLILTNLHRWSGLGA